MNIVRKISSKLPVGLKMTLKKITPVPIKKLVRWLLRWDNKDSVMGNQSPVLQNVAVEKPIRPVYEKQTEEYQKVAAVRDSVYLEEPIRILSRNRLDLVARYLLFRGIIDKVDNAKNIALYSRMVLSRTGGHEVANKYSEQEKFGIDEYLKAARELCDSVINDGFKPEYYVPVGNDYTLLNGAHRIALSLALDEKVWIRRFEQDGIGNFTWAWFVENNFSTEDKLRILRGYADIKDNCGIFVLYAPIKEQWEYVRKILDDRIGVVGYIDLDFSNDVIAFENLIHEIYQDYIVDENDVIYRKANLLKYSELKIRVILTDNTQNRDSYYNELTEIKDALRKTLNFDVLEKAYCSLHSSDSKEEFRLLKNILLSPNNLKMLSNRLTNIFRKEFIDWLGNFKCYCAENNIDVNDTCIVGSSPLEVAGIRASTDIDIMLTSELRLKYGDGITHLTDTLDIATRNYVRDGGSVILSDDILIHNHDYHFCFYGCKFANVELVKRRKSYQGRDKDIEDVRLIQMYEDYIRCFDDKKVLSEQIKKEIMKRTGATVIYNENEKNIGGGGN